MLERRELDRGAFQRLSLPRRVGVPPTAPAASSLGRLGGCAAVSPTAGHHRRRLFAPPLSVMPFCFDRGGEAVLPIPCFTEELRSGGGAACSSTARASAHCVLRKRFAGELSTGSSSACGCVITCTILLPPPAADCRHQETLFVRRCWRQGSTPRPPRRCFTPAPRSPRSCFYNLLRRRRHPLLLFPMSVLSPTATWQSLLLDRY